ncbi:hypothetical protein M5D96_012675, partial [Drosophila gunungcola]
SWNYNKSFAYNCNVKKGRGRSKLLKKQLNSSKAVRTIQPTFVDATEFTQKDGSASGSYPSALADEIHEETNGYLSQWASSLKEEVENILQNDEGDDLNPREC